MRSKRYLSVLGLALIGSAIIWQIGLRSERKSTEAFARGVIPVSYFSVRGSTNNGSLTPGHSPYGYKIVGPIPGLNGNTPKPKDLVIVEHGLNNTEVKAVNRFGLAKQSLEHNGYDGQVVGFSWDGSTNIDPWGATGYKVARRNAEASGTMLAQIISDYHKKCPSTRIHLIGYSMGAKVALEAVRALNTDAHFRNSDAKVTTIFLVGAAIPYHEVQKTERYGTCIERRAGMLVNCFSPKDSKLGSFFKVMELARALGRTDAAGLPNMPKNYRSLDVSTELPGVDSSGNIDPSKERGHNHSAYLGVRNDAGKWLDDGAMNVVARFIKSGK